MLKLYKCIGGELYYWETWEVNDVAMIHWGKVGEMGLYQEVKSGLFSNYKKNVKKEADKKVAEGYSKLEDDQLSFLEIEYIIDGFGTEEDLDKRHRLEEKMDEVLGWTGLGHCDGGSIGSGTMEVGCVVVDFDLARTVIEKQLADTEFANYSRIFKIELD